MRRSRPSIAAGAILPSREDLKNPADPNSDIYIGTKPAVDVPPQNRLVLVAAAAIAFCGCSPEPHKARYTVDDYVANPGAMDAKLKECAKIPCAPEADPARR